jgi:hypothetical protein
LSANGRETAASELGCPVLPLIETESTMETAAECYRHAVQCDHLAKFALSDADRDVMLAARDEPFKRVSVYGSAGSSCGQRIHDPRCLKAIGRYFIFSLFVLRASLSSPAVAEQPLAGHGWYPYLDFSAARVLPISLSTL